MNCPRCNGPLVREEDGPTCRYCGYVDYTNGRSFAETLELMAQVPNRSAPRLPAPSRAEVYKDEMAEERRQRGFIATMQAKKVKQAAEDEVLFEAAARRVGVETAALQGSDKSYSALRHAVCIELRAKGLSYQRIATVMGKHARAIQYWFEAKA